VINNQTKLKSIFNINLKNEYVLNFFLNNSNFMLQLDIDLKFIILCFSFNRFYRYQVHIRDKTNIMKCFILISIIFKLKKQI